MVLVGKGTQLGALLNVGGGVGRHAAVDGELTDSHPTLIGLRNTVAQHACLHGLICQVEYNGCTALGLIINDLPVLAVIGDFKHTGLGEVACARTTHQQGDGADVGRLLEVDAIPIVLLHALVRGPEGLEVAV